MVQHKEEQDIVKLSQLQKKKLPKIVLGRYESVSFPELNISSIEAKIDTGAYSSAIHAHKIWTEKIDGHEILKFDLLDPSIKGYIPQIIESSNFKRKRVRSSNGRLEERFVIKTILLIGGKKRITDLSLTNRKKMKFPVLIGRKLLGKGFLVDVSINNIKKQ